VILGSKSRGTHDRILLSDGSDSLQTSAWEELMKPASFKHFEKGKIIPVLN
jgi:hypothetical protein